MEVSAASKEVSRMKKQQKEKDILCQIAVLLTREKFLNPEDHVRFLALLREET